MPNEVEPTVEENPNIEAPATDEVPVVEEESAEKIEEVQVVPKEVEEVAVVEESPVADTKDEVIAEFGEVKITKQDYHDTMNEIKVIVESLNKVAKTKDYVKWLTFLSESYRTDFSKTPTFRVASENLKKKTGGTVKLSSLQDYFKYVFVPSRQNIKVDDIEFLSPQRVNVLMLAKGRQLLIYDLEKIKGRWLLLPRK